MLILTAILSVSTLIILVSLISTVLVLMLSSPAWIVVLELHDAVHQQSITFHSKLDGLLRGPLLLVFVEVDLNLISKLVFKE